MNHSLNMPFSMRFIFTFALFLLSSGAAAMHAQTSSTATTTNPSPILLPGAARSDAPYTVGERLTYNVSFSNFPSAAHLELTVANRGTFFGREAIELQAHVETTGVVNAALYAINNDYLTYIDAVTKLPFRTTEAARDGAQAGASARDYNQPLGTEAIPSRSRAVLVAGNYDFLSALYRIRALPLAERGVYRLQLESNASQVSGRYDIEVKVAGREQIKSNVGSFNTIVVTARPLRAGDNAPRVQVNFTDDARHVPVRIAVQLPQGTIQAELASSELPAAPPPIIVTNAPNAVAAVVAPPIVAPPVPNSLNPRESLPFKVGEQLNYNIFLGAGAQPAGLISAQVRPNANYFGRTGLMLAASAQTLTATPSAASLFAVYDNINSYIDPETLLPFRTELRAADSPAASIINFEQSRGTVRMSDGTQVAIPVGTHDLVSIAYALRLFRLTPPNRTSVSVFINNRPRTVTMVALAREAILIGDQRVPAVQVSVTLDGAEADKYQMRLWISDDATRTPLRFAAMTAIGSVRADLAILPVVSQ